MMNEIMLKTILIFFAISNGILFYLYFNIKLSLELKDKLTQISRFYDELKKLLRKEK